jgi:hypothetical protein
LRTSETGSLETASSSGESGANSTSARWFTSPRWARLPLLTWIMFLKFLDDLEIERDEDAERYGWCKPPNWRRCQNGAHGQRVSAE